MLHKKHMHFLPAEAIDSGHFILFEHSIFKVLRVEWPYAVVRAYEDGALGERSFKKLEGEYSIPSVTFLTELGLYRLDDPAPEPEYVLFDDDEERVEPRA